MDPWKDVGYAFEVDDTAAEVTSEVARALAAGVGGTPKSPELAERQLASFGVGGWSDVPMHSDERRDLVVAISREIGSSRAPISWAGRAAGHLSVQARTTELVGTTVAALPNIGYGLRRGDAVVGIPADIGATHVVVIDGEQAALYDMSQMAVDSEPMDPSVRLVAVRGSAVDRWSIDETERLWIEELVPVLLAADAVGAAERAWLLARDHVQSRKQFGRALAENQVVRLQLASAAVELIRCRAILADWCQQGERPPGGHSASPDLFRVLTGAARRQARVLVHLHGATGYTAEHPVGWCLLRVVQDAALVGWSHREEADAA